MTKKLLFRADGNSTIGLGHLYRLFALVELYKKNNDFVFITRNDSTLKVIPNNYFIDTVPKTIDLINEPEWFATNYKANEYIIIIDGYQFTADYQKKIKQLGYTLIYIDDIITDNQYADIVINHAEGLHKNNYSTEYYTQLALGTQYAILRPSFLEAIKNKRTIKNIDTAFVCFGGADMYDLSYKATKALLHFSKFKEIHILLGGAYKHKFIFELQDKNSNIHIYQNLREKEIVSIMQLCNFAIAPASTTLYELCAIQMPILSGYFVKNQLNIYNSFLKKGAIYGCNNFSEYTISNFIDSIQEVINLKEYHLRLKSQQQLFDNKINNRFFELLKYARLSVRKAIKDDSFQVYNWSNDSLVRESSYNSKPIILDDHKKWFDIKINENNCLFYIIEYNSIPAGMVRYEVKEENAVIGITIAKEFRGNKLASLFLSKTAKEYFQLFEKPIFAYIKKENKASIKAFKKAKYLLYKEEKINNIDSFIYKLQKK
ncbi:UDP-2,4-diacetamido-2,4,6-trideoxy-beta-L-altropyranose hydrolase [Tenacibaculum pacificus]|uniref:UDP-2,4-diacetamido-2,4, 6-trideoxy-beta-L-altropyranose hydrolase n=1 Tax=Tenacibaculum pacificus TaxID=3018314 RepID=UPI0022F38079|nr:UDP-2,4-diacetamido-2,4,6-trideoxy-beta-L-altropyranose hydrolase [Tenacibaculum pacificus]WBX74532.1 UDP-2,4-diacetamido-2,4,6-trideoxy-beta-L-altropyranose hydrolase [Tenacibaculum pacificus]